MINSKILIDEKWICGELGNADRRDIKEKGLLLVNMC
jgi:hypothetical protein